MKKECGGYMTLEAAMIFPAVFAFVIMLLYVTFFLYDKCRLTQDLYTAAYRQSIARGENVPESRIDTSGYFMMSSCSAGVEGKSEVSASASGELAPALLTGTEEGRTLWELKVTMRARRTDPPCSFRKFRRVSEVARQVLGQ